MTQCRELNEGNYIPAQCIRCGKNTVEGLLFDGICMDCQLAEEIESGQIDAPVEDSPESEYHVMDTDPMVLEVERRSNIAASAERQLSALALEYPEPFRTTYLIKLVTMEATRMQMEGGPDTLGEVRKELFKRKEQREFPRKRTK